MLKFKKPIKKNLKSLSKEKIIQDTLKSIHYLSSSSWDKEFHNNAFICALKLIDLSRVKNIISKKEAFNILKILLIIQTQKNNKSYLLEELKHLILNQKLNNLFIKFLHTF